MPSAEGAAGRKHPRSQQDTVKCTEYLVPLSPKVINFWSLVALTAHFPEVFCTHWEKKKKPEVVELVLDMPAWPGERAGRAL